MKDAGKSSLYLKILSSLEEGRECGKESRKVKGPKTNLDGTGTVYK